MGSSGCAAVGVVTELVDVHATLSIGVVALDIPCDGSRGALGILLESNGAGDLRVSSDGSNCKRRETCQQGSEGCGKTTEKVEHEMLLDVMLRGCLDGNHPGCYIPH